MATATIAITRVGLTSSEKTAHSCQWPPTQPPSSSTSFNALPTHQHPKASKMAKYAIKIYCDPTIEIPHKWDWNTISLISVILLVKNSRNDIVLDVHSSFYYFLQLKNPTRYHVLQSHKRQVRELLTSSWQKQLQGDNPDVDHKHLLCPPRASAMMPRSAPDELFLPRDGETGVYVANASSAPESNQVTENPAEPTVKVGHFTFSLEWLQIYGCWCSLVRFLSYVSSLILDRLKTFFR